MSNRPKRRPAAPPRPSSTTRRRRFWEWPVLWVVVLAAAAIVITVSVTGGADTDSAVARPADSAAADPQTSSETEPVPPIVVAETAFAEILGAPLPPFSEPDPAIGRDVPSIAAQTFAGERVQIRADGTARLYGFFAHWCPHCQNELPRTTAWLEANTVPPGVEVLAISTSVEPTAGNYPPSEWFSREGWPARVIVDGENSPVAAGFGLTGFPYWVAVDSDGAVVARRSGELDTSQFEELLELIAPEDPIDEASQSAPGIRLVSPTEGAAIAAEAPPGLTVLDVRTPEEFAEGHLAGAIMIDFYTEDFADQLAQLDPDKPYLLYCRSGNRSGQTRAFLAELGFTDVADIEGGILNWIDSDLPVVTS